MIINFVLNNINHIAQLLFVSSLNIPCAIYSALCLCLCSKIIYLFMLYDYTAVVCSDATPRL